MNKKQEIIRGHLTCTCDEVYKSRNMVDPNCFLCEYESEIELIMDEYAEQQLKNCNIPHVSNNEVAVCKAPTHILPCSHFYSNRCLQPNHCNYKQTDC